MAMTQMLMAGAEGEAPIFPAAYQTLINGYSAANTRYYDIANGNDSNNGQTEATAKKNLGTDLSSWLSGSNGRIAVLMPGTYPITAHGPGSYGIRMFYWHTNSKMVCAPGRVTVTGVAPSGRDFHIFGMRNADAGIYGAIIQRNNGGRTTNYNTAMWGYNANDTSGDVYNCVVKEVNGNNNMSHVYDNTSGGNRYMERSTIASDMTLDAYTCGASTADNIALTSSVHRFCGTVNNAKTSITYGTSPSGFPYYITNNTSDNSTYGVYGGTYAWTP